MATMAISKNTDRVRFFVDEIHDGVVRDCDGRIAILVQAGEHFIDVETGDVYATSFTVNTTIYLMGGRNSSNVKIADNDSFDGTSWTSETDVPDALEAMGVCSLGANVYAGYGRDAAYELNLYKWNGSTWSTESSSANAPGRFAPGAGGLGSKVYFMGGYDASTPIIADNDSWNGAAWTAETNVPSPQRYNPGQATMDSKIYLASGDTVIWGEAQNDSFDGTSWAAETDVPSPSRVGAKATVRSAGFNLMGGRPIGSWVADNDLFDGTSWTAETDVPSPLRGHASAGQVGGNAYLCSGDSPSGLILDNDEWDGTSWTAKSNVPSPSRRFHGSDGV